jgi:hypothetical protein
MRPFRALLAALPLWALLLGNASLGANPSRLFVRTIPDEKTFDVYSRVVGSDRIGKFLIDLKSSEIYFFDVNIYRLHADFVFHVIYRKTMQAEDVAEYNKNYQADKPRFVLGYLTHHLKTDQWTFGFWEGDRIRAADVRKVSGRLRASFFSEKLLFRPDSPLQEKLLAELGELPSITNDKLYKSASYQAFNTGKATGVLRVIPQGTSPEAMLFQPGEIVILQESYPDIPPVSGVLVTEFSTPLAHVNLRAKEWGIPNAGFKGAASGYAHLDGKTVVFEVRDRDHELRLATDAEVAAWKAAGTQAKEVRVPAANLRTRDLRPLRLMRRVDARSYGAKAANLGEIASAKLAGVFVPDGFGVPFAFYVDHMKRHRLDQKLGQLLGDPRFATDAAFRKSELLALRAAIVLAPLDARLLSSIHAKVARSLGGKGVFVRSSTNAEDLQGFNGAGLYTTVPNVKGKKALGLALKTVWASLWNFHAVEQRSFFGIDHRSVYAGVLVQIALLENWSEETDPGRSHLDIVLRFAEANGANLAEVKAGRGLPTTEAWVAWQLYTAKEKSWVAGVSALVGTETQSPMLYSKLLPALREIYKFPEDVIEHFWLHVDADTEHGDRSFEMLERHCTTQDLREEALYYVRESARRRWFHFDGIYLHYELGYKLQ